MTCPVDADIFRKIAIFPVPTVPNHVMYEWDNTSMPDTCIIAAHDPWFIQLLRMYVEECGFAVVHAYESQDVFPAIHKEKPSVIIMQADLPGKLAGWEVLYLIKGDPYTCHIPTLIFAWRSYGLDQMISNMKDGNATLLREPVTFQSFQEALRKTGVHIPS